MATAESFRKGRPPRFKSAEELQEKIDTYFDRCESLDKPLTMSGLGYYLGISRQTILNYSRKEDFFDVINDARARVQMDMEERGLGGESNPAVSIFSLKNNFGWVDRQEIKQEVSGLEQFFEEDEGEE